MKNYNKMFNVGQLKGDQVTSDEMKGNHVTVIEMKDDQITVSEPPPDKTVLANIEGGSGVIMDPNAIISWNDKNPPPVEPKTAKVISRGKLNVRKSPDKNSEVVCLLTPGTQLMVEIVNDGWAHVYTSSGIEGYVLAEFIKEV